MSYSTSAVANFLLDLADADREALSPMKLQKLVYYANGWHLALKGVPLINEPIQAWPFGPVISSLYHEFKESGDQPITRRVSEDSWIWPAEGAEPEFKTEIPSIREEAGDDAEFTESLLRKVWLSFKPYTAIQLSNMTHAEGTPWELVNRQHGGRIPKRTVISNDSMRDYFRTKADRRS